MNYQQFANKWLTPSGQSIADSVLLHQGFQPNQIYQDVALIRQYFHEVFGMEVGYVSSPKDYWDNLPADLLSKFHRIAGSDALQGDVVILTGERDHIGIATGNGTDVTLEILEQNGATGTGEGTGDNAIRTIYVPRASIFGLLRFIQDELVAARQPYTLEVIDPRRIVTNKQTYLWNISYSDYASLVSNPVSPVPIGTTKTINAICHHESNHDFYLENEDDAFGYGIDDCDNYVISTVTPRAVPAAPVPFPAAEKYQLLSVVKYYGSYADATHDSNALGTKNVGSYYVFERKGSFINLTDKASKDMHWWVNTSENIAPVVVAPRFVPKIPKPIVNTTPEVLQVKPTQWKDTYSSLRPDRRGVKYYTTKNLMIHDYSGHLPDVPITKDESIWLYGTFIVDGVVLYRPHLKTDNGVENYYGIPMFDPEFGTPNLLLEANLDPYDTTTSLQDRKALNTLNAHDYYLLMKEEMGEWYNKAWKVIDGILKKPK